METTSLVHAPRSPKLPATSHLWIALVLVALAAVSLGAYAFWRQTSLGLISTGMRNPGRGGAAWGLYITFDVFFVGVSFAGITVAAICRLFEVETLRPITRIAELLTITALLAGAGVVLADLGRPGHGLLKLPRYANPSSPFYGTFTLVVAGYLFSSLVYFFLSGRADAAALAAQPGRRWRWLYVLWASGYRDTPAQRARHHAVSFWLALSILPLLVTAHSTLGFIFGLQAGRPGWFSALQAPAFVVLAGVSGTGMVILVGLGFRRLFRRGDLLPDATFRWLGNFMWVLSLVYLYFMIIDELTATYLAPAADRHLAHHLTAGRFAPLFWVAVTCVFASFLVPFILYVTRRESVRAVAVAAVLANVGAVLKRFVLVVPSQTHGALMPLERPAPYHPQWGEYAIVIALAAMAALMMLLFGRLFPLVPGAHARHGREPAGRRRTALTIATATVAVALVGVGLTDSFRMWSRGHGDPLLPYSPVLFATGVMLLFASAVVYELFPGPAPRPRRGVHAKVLSLHTRLGGLARVTANVHAMALPIGARTAPLEERAAARAAAARAEVASELRRAEASWDEHADTTALSERLRDLVARLDRGLR
jgi:molybdopterin-containing oxidoreductase family membrane subunit